MAYTFYKNTIIATAVLAMGGITLNTVFAFPFESDRYGMLELTQKGDGFIMVVTDIVTDGFGLGFMV